MSEVSETKDKAPSKPWTMDNTVIGWSKKGYDEFVRRYEILPEWEPEYPGKGCTAKVTPMGKIALYEAHFFVGFRLPATKFVVGLLTSYGIHITQMSLKMVHYEMTCRAIDIEPTFELFDAFYEVEVVYGIEGWYSIKHRNKRPFMSDHAPQSLHRWKEKFFYVHRGVLPVKMQWMVLGRNERLERRPFPNAVAKGEDYDTLVSHVSRLDTILQCSERFFTYFGVSRIRLREGQQIEPKDEGMLLLSQCFCLHV